LRRAVEQVRCRTGNALREAARRKKKLVDRDVVARPAVCYDT
jgi:hypothetical protein